MKLSGKKKRPTNVMLQIYNEINSIERIIAFCPKYQRERRSYQINENPQKATRAVNWCSSVSNFSKCLNIFSFVRSNMFVFIFM